MSSRSSMVLLHGWAANHHVFDDFRRYLPDVPVFAPDLPGHGDDVRTSFDAAAFADEVAQNIGEPANIIAWSLGGQVALQLAARHPHKVASLCLCATFAKLLQTDGYSAGLVQSRLINMIPFFEADYAHAMQQFLQLQILYTPARKPTVADLLPRVAACPVPRALKSAQDYAARADVRDLLADIHAPVLCVYGDKDTITPPRLGEYLREQLPNASLLKIKHAVHAPFISHPQLFADALNQFWNHHHD